MRTLLYPVFCMTIDTQQQGHCIFATVLGTNWEVVDNSVGKIKKILSDHIRKTAADDYYWQAPEIERAKLRLVTVKVHPAYREEQGQYPLPQPTPIKIAAVYGHNAEQGYWKCYLPVLETEFYYYEERQLPGLIEHFTRDELEGEAPEYVHRYVHSRRPWLEHLRIRIDTKPTLRRPDPLTTEADQRLRGVAELLPLERAVRRKTALLPDVAWERTALVDDLVEQFLRQPNNVLLIGEPGVGKTAVWLEVIRLLKQKSRNREQPALTFWRSSAERLTADARYLGEWQQICEDIVDDLVLVNGVLWIIDIVNLFGTNHGTDASDSVAAFLLPLLQNNKLFMIGEMHPQQVHAIQQLLPGFLDYFRLIEVDELSHDQLNRILDRLTDYATTQFNIRLQSDAVALSIRLLQRYQPYERFPGKAMNFFSGLMRNAQRSMPALPTTAVEISTDAVITAMIAQTGLPELILRDELPLENDALLAFFAHRIIGQETALRPLCQTVTIYKSGLNDPDKPIATLLFAGPTGVGKTAAAKALAEFFFSAGQTREPLFRIDMSEYQHPQQMNRLIGGEHSPGKLIEHVRANPFSVILLDEIEKANVQFFDVLLALLDEGRLQDAFGRVTDFRSCIIVMTSNLGTANSAAVGFAARSDSHNC